MVTDDAQLEGCGAARSSAPSVSAAAGALCTRAEPAGPGCFVRLQLWQRLTVRCCPTRHTLRAARHRSPSGTPDKSLGRSTQQHTVSLRRSWSLARARGAGRPVGRRRLTGTSRSCQCCAHAPVLQLRQTVYLGAYSRHEKAELLRYSRTRSRSGSAPPQSIAGSPARVLGRDSAGSQKSYEKQYDFLERP